MVLKFSLLKFILIASLILLGGCSANNSDSDNGLEENPVSEEQTVNKVYESNLGFSFEYPEYYDKLTEEYVADASTGKTIQFFVAETTLEDLNSWIQSEIERKLSGTEADQSLVEPLNETKQGDLIVYRYTIGSDPGDGTPVVIPTVIFFDGSKRYEFRTTLPPATEEEFNLVIDTFKLEP